MNPSVSAAYVLRTIQAVTPMATTASGPWPRALIRKVRVPIVSQSALPMPTEISAAPTRVVEALVGPSRWRGDDATAALERLLTLPTIAVPHAQPDRDKTQHLLGGEPFLRHAKPRCVTFLLGLDANGLPRTVGVARLVIVEAGFQFGHSLLADAEINWCYSLEDLIPRILEVRSDMLVKDARALPERAVFLGLPPERREDVRIKLKDLAGAYGVNLTCLPEPGSHIGAQAAALRKRPPAALYIWRPYAGATRQLEHAVRHARANVRVTGIDETALEDMLIEFGWYLSDQLGLEENLVIRTAHSLVQHVDWEYLRERLLALDSSAFLVHSDALECCDSRGYGYSSPGRLLGYIQTFASAAHRFGQLRGQVGKRFEDWIMEEYGLEVALFDSKQSGKEYEVDGRAFTDIAHIKVDDHKHGLTQAGRIHFIIDNIQHRIILTYLGSHR